VSSSGSSFVPTELQCDLDFWLIKFCVICGCVYVMWRPGACRSIGLSADLALEKSLCTYKMCWKWCPWASLQDWTKITFHRLSAQWISERTVVLFSHGCQSLYAPLPFSYVQSPAALCLAFLPNDWDGEVACTKGGFKSVTRLLGQSRSSTPSTKSAFINTVLPWHLTPTPLWNQCYSQSTIRD
jgi:hypothetical protein